MKLRFLPWSNQKGDVVSQTRLPLWFYPKGGIASKELKRYNRRVRRLFTALIVLIGPLSFLKGALMLGPIWAGVVAIALEASLYLLYRGCRFPSKKSTPSG